MGTDVKSMKVADLRGELARRGLSTEGLKAELVNRLQARLDEEEFGLADAPGSTEKKAAKDSAGKTEVKEQAATAEQAAEEAKPGDSSNSALESTKDSIDSIKGEESKESMKEEETSSPTKTATVEGADAAAGTTIATVPKENLSFEEKKKLRAERFQIPVVGTEDEKDGKKGAKSRKREGSEIQNDVAKEEDSKKKPKIVDVSFVEKLSKEELEKRLKRAKRFDVDSNVVDAMKAAMRKFRFEETK